MPRPAPPEPLDKTLLLRLSSAQHARWTEDAAEYGVSLAEWIRSGVEIVEDGAGREQASDTALECLSRLIASSRGRRRKAWSRAKMALVAAIRENET